MTSDHEAHILERLARVTPVRSRKMFGGVGIYSGEFFFALIASDVLYLKVDDTNRADFEARGMSAFQPFADRESTMSYFELPADVLDDPRKLKPWIEKALTVARASKTKKPVKTATKPRRGQSKRTR
ncbi:MAG: TfoX/Sxy family protein [Planctomycetota bacterium]|nr:TfoX/Sxy family protein [Planctomycetota bacterium]